MLTYIEPCGWCSSSISSTYCPSNVGKPVEPCPDLSSSSRSSTSSLISNNDTRLSLSIHSIASEDPRRTTSTCRIRASAHHPEDYHTNKRIEQLHERMDDIQISNFLRFINHHLGLKKATECLHINDFIVDLSNGHILIDLIELFSSTKLKREHGRTRFHALSNIQSVLDYLKHRVQHLNISPHDIVSGNRKQILALLWIIMKTFDFPDFQLKKKNCFVENTLLGFGQDRSMIIKWLNGILHHSQTSINDFSLQTWSNGHHLSFILKYLLPFSLKYFTMQCFDYLKELNSSCKQRLEICFQFSSYCFDTQTIIDYTDRTDMCLFKYFTELHGNISMILKSNQLGKIMQSNPYTKDILQTVIQSTEHSSDVSYDNEQYLVWTGKKEKQDITFYSTDQSQYPTDDLSRIRTVEKSRLFNDKQQAIISKKINRWEKAENIPSHSPLINGRHDISEEIIDKVPGLNSTSHSTETSQPLALADHCQNVVSTTVTDAEIEQISLCDIKNALDQISGQIQPSIENDQSPLVTIAESDTPVLEEEIIMSDKEEETVTSVQDIKESTIVLDEQQPFVSDENMKPLEEIEVTTVNELVIDVNETEKTELFLVEHKQIDLSLESQPLMMTNDRSEQVSNESIEQHINQVIADEQSTDHTMKIEQIQPVSVANEDVNQAPTPIETIEKSIENQFVELPLNGSSSQTETEPNSIIIIENNLPSNDEKSEESRPSPDTTAKEVEKPMVMESYRPVASNQYRNGTTRTNSKKSATNTKRSVTTASSQPENSRPSVFKEPQTSSTIVVEPLKPHPAAAERPTIPKPSKYSDIVRKPTPKANNEPRQGGISMQRAEQSSLSTFKAISSPIVSNEKSKQSHVTAEEIQQVTLTSTIEEPEPAQVSLDKQDQSTGNLEEPSTSTHSTEEETKKSPGKNKKSRRSNAKKNKGKTSPVKTENPPQPSSTIIVEQPMSNVATPSASSPSDSSALRSRKSKKKKTIATTSTTLIENSSSSSSAKSHSDTSHRNLLLVIRESLGDRKFLAFKFVFILICLCSSILILVLSHK